MNYFKSYYGIKIYTSLMFRILLVSQWNNSLKYSLSPSLTLGSHCLSPVFIARASELVFQSLLHPLQINFHTATNAIFPKTPRVLERSSLKLSVVFLWKIDEAWHRRPMQFLPLYSILISYLSLSYALSFFSVKLLIFPWTSVQFHTSDFCTCCSLCLECPPFIPQNIVLYTMFHSPQNV